MHLACSRSQPYYSTLKWTWHDLVFSTDVKKCWPDLSNRLYSPCSKRVKNWVRDVTTKILGIVCRDNEGQQTWRTANAFFRTAIAVSEMQLTFTNTEYLRPRCTRYVFSSQNNLESVFKRCFSAVRHVFDVPPNDSGSLCVHKSYPFSAPIAYVR